jgi:hypothetical protein
MPQPLARFPQQAGMMTSPLRRNDATLAPIGGSR